MRRYLWRWLAECGIAWAEHLRIALSEIPPLLDVEQALKTNLKVSIFKVLRDLSQWSKKLSVSEQRIASLYRGLILTADHAASAGAPAFPQLHLTLDIAARPLKGVKNWRSHQHNAAQAGRGSMLLIAPTGSGKTEAALLWAARQIEHQPASRLFYTLPYQASMNAMEKRLRERCFQGDTPVTIQHSRATLKFYQDMMEADSGLNPKQAARQAKARKNLAELNYYPVQVFSPYQMLKAAYSLKGYEALLVDYTGGLFIFDEIHAYDPKRLALIITMMGWLARNYQARFLVMTATMPPMIRDALKAALSLADDDVIAAGDEVFRASQRHEVHIVDGDLQDALDTIEQAGRKQKVLVCCNQVARAQEVYQRLKDEYGFTRDDMMLLHGRFNGRDRSRKENALEQAVGVGASQRPYIVVATQVVEVSLNIDLDTIYTEPAPLEALIQRFGRVNRGRGEKAPLCPVHVFRQPMGEKESKPYDFPLVQAGLEVLEQYCGGGRPIDEALVTTMLRTIYEREAIAGEWWKEYRRSERMFREVLDRMKPYQSADPGTFQAFYRLFDGRQIVPWDWVDLYQDALEANGFLEASQYLVNVTEGQYRQMQGAGRVRGCDDYGIGHVEVPYSEEWGLDIAGALSARDEDE